ncbi:MAG: propionate catabolism operon regulatory protein PrpR [Burkholderiales bacterium]|nr:propionate catabolism operon regulatory protein PrpR [Burkholderiales bacterium]
MPQPQIVFVATHALAELVRALAVDMVRQATLQVVERTVEEALPVLQDWIRNGRVDVVVAAGRGAELLRAQVRVPVVAVKVTGYDVLRAVTRARAMGEHPMLLTRRRVADEFAQLRPVLSVDVTPVVYERDQEALQYIAAATQTPSTVVIGSSQIVRLASQYTLPTVLIYSIDSIKEAIESALELVRVARMEEAKRERLDAVLESLAEGVVAVDNDERVQTMNPAMAKLLGASLEWALGRRLSEIEPALSLADVLKAGEGRRDEVANMSGRRLVLQRMPLWEAGVQVGAVLTVQESAAIERADRKLRADVRRHPFRARYRLDDVLGTSPAISEARNLATVFAQADSSVLLAGASGTGKELFAQGIHMASLRAGGPFVALNCAAFPESLLESELFGYEEGAFTGSRRGGKQGLLEMADRGTLFLDEIGDMPLPLQTRLLRVLQEREVLRLGGSEPIPVDVRVMAATHADLKVLVKEGRFRADLYYRLNILSLRLPSLAERGDDIRHLATALAEDAFARLGVPLQASILVDPLLRVAGAYGWPGNVRELQNVIERFAVFLRAGGALSEAQMQALAPELSGDEDAGGAASTLHDTADELRRRQAVLALDACNGDRAAAAAQLGISRTTLWRILKN